MNPKVDEIKNKVFNQADELYNKLPLDKINDKLGGKVDVKSKKFKMGVFIAVPVLFLLIVWMIFSGGGKPSSSEISTSMRRLNRIEKNIGEGRVCKSISDFKKVKPITLPSSIAKQLGLKGGEECKRYTCTITWKDGSTSQGVFIRQGDKFGVIPRDWAE